MYFIFYEDQFFQNFIVVLIMSNVWIDKLESSSLRWYMLNIDGTHKSSLSMVTLGGAIWDWYGKWIVGFSRLIGSSSALELNFRVLFKGFSLSGEMDKEELFLDWIILTLLMCWPTMQKLGSITWIRKLVRIWRRNGRWLYNTSTREVVSLLMA